MTLFKKIYNYFGTPERKVLTLTLMWIFFFITLGYMLICMFWMTSWHFFVWLIPGAITLFLRLAYSKASYDPMKDHFSDEYVPYKKRAKKKKHKKK
jgi:hypothetical protein